MSVATFPDVAIHSGSKVSKDEVLYRRRWVIVGVFAVSLALTCGTFINSNGVRAMWRVAGIPCSPANCQHGDGSPNCQWAENKMMSWLKAFQSSEMIFACAGFILDYLGPRLTFSVAHLIFLCALSLLWLNYISSAMWVAGVTTTLMMNPCLSLGNIFTDRRNLAMSILSGSVDVAAFSFPIAKTIHDIWSWFGYYDLIKWFAVCSICSIVLGLWLLPSKVCQNREQLLGEETRLSSSSSTQLLYTSGSGVAAAGETPDRVRPSLRSQVFAPKFLVFCFIWTTLAVRINGYFDYNEAIVHRYGGGSWMAEAFGYLIPFSFIPCILTGMLTDRIGVVKCTILINAGSLLVNIFSLIPILHLQWITLVVFVFTKSGLFTLMYCFVAEIMGMHHFGTLPAIVAVCGGIANTGAGFLARRFLEAGGSILTILGAHLALGVGAQFLAFKEAQLTARPSK